MNTHTITPMTDAEGMRAMRAGARPRSAAQRYPALARAERNARRATGRMGRVVRLGAFGLAVVGMGLLALVLLPFAGIAHEHSPDRGRSPLDPAHRTRRGSGTFETLKPKLGSR